MQVLVLSMLERLVQGSSGGTEGSSRPMEGVGPMVQLLHSHDRELVLQVRHGGLPRHRRTPLDHATSMALQTASAHVYMLLSGLSQVMSTLRQFLGPLGGAGGGVGEGGGGGGGEGGSGSAGGLDGTPRQSGSKGTSLAR